MCIADGVFSGAVNNWIYERHHKDFPAMTLFEGEEDKTKMKTWDNTSCKDVLGINFINLKTSVEEMSDVLIKNKYFD